MPKFRKKPVEIEAVLWDGTEDSTHEAMAFCNSDNVFHVLGSDGAEAIEIETLEGRMTASVGDYIIRGLKGELYPCKPDIFAASYDRV
jgi:hypothetical protein